MEFDKSRVYTAVNADELKIGSKCIFADSLGALRDYVKSDCTKEMLKGIEDEHEEERFRSEQDSLWHLAYLIEPPAEKKYKPFGSVEKAMKAIKKHGGWIRSRVNNLNYLVTRYGKDDLYIDTTFLDVKELFKCFFFADDGSPCGVPVEE